MASKIRFWLPTSWARVRKWDPRTLITIAVLAFAWFVVFSSKPVTFSPDEAYYMVIGRNISIGQGPIDNYGELAAEHPPLLPVMLALAFQAGNATVETAALVPKLFACFNILLVFGIGWVLRDWRTGLVAALMASSSVFMLSFSGRVLLDNVLASFMLASLLATVLAIRKDSNILMMVAGALLGIAFLIKELALIWLFVPIILLSLTWNKRLIRYSIAFYLSFGLSVAWWWIYFYIQTGQIYLMHAPNRNFGAILGPLVLAFTVTLIPIALGIFVWRKLISIGCFTSALRRIRQQAHIIFGCVFLAVAWVVLTVLLLRIGAPLRGLENIPSRLQYTLSYIQSFWLSVDIWQSVALMAYALLLFMTVVKRQVAMVAVSIGALLYAPLLFVISVPTTNTFPIRQALTLLWLTYPVVSFSVIALIDFGVDAVMRSLQAMKFGTQMQHEARSKWLAFGIAFMVIAGYALRINLDYLRANWQSNYLTQHSSTLNESTIRLGNWLANNTFTASEVLTTPALARELSWVMNGVHRIGKVVPGTSADWYTDWLIDTNEGLSYVAPGALMDSSSLLYVEQAEMGYRSPRYFEFTTHDLMRALNTGDSEYIAIATGQRLRANFREVPRFFLDVPAFQHLYSDESLSGFNMDIFRVDAGNFSLRQLQSYPLTIDRDVISWWVDRQRDGASRDAILALAKDLLTKPTVILRAGNRSEELYTFLAETLRQLNRPNLSAFAYAQMLSEEPSLAKKLTTVARDMTTDYVGNAGPWVLTGDVYFALDRYEQAKNAYEKALISETSMPILEAAANLGLAKVAAVGHSYENGLEFAKKAGETSLFGASDALYLANMLQMHLSASHNTQKAVDRVKAAIRANAPQALADYLGKRLLGVENEEFYDEKTEAVLQQAMINSLHFQPLLNAVFEDTSWWQYRADEGDKVKPFLAAVQRSIEQQPFDRTRYMRLADIHLIIDDIDGAQATYTSIIEQLPNDATAWQLLASVFEKQGQIDAAASAYVQALTINPGSVESIKRLIGFARQNNQIERIQEILNELNGKQQYSAAVRIEIGKFLLSMATGPGMESDIGPAFVR